MEWRAADCPKSAKAALSSAGLEPGVRIHSAGMPMRRKTLRKSVEPSSIPMAATRWASERSMSRTRERTLRADWRREC